MARSHPSRASIVKRIVALGITALAFYVLLPSISRVVGAWPRLANLSAAWFAGAVIAEVASFACTFALQRIVLRTCGWFAVVAAGLTGNAVTNVFPGGSAVGAAVQFRMLATVGIDTDNAAGGLAASSLLSVGGLLALPVLALPAILGGTQVSQGLDHAALLGLGAFGLFVLCGIAIMVFDRPLSVLGSLVQRILNMIPRRRNKTTDLSALAPASTGRHSVRLGPKLVGCHLADRRTARIRLPLLARRSPLDGHQSSPFPRSAGLRRRWRDSSRSAYARRSGYRRGKPQWTTRTRRRSRWERCSCDACLSFDLLLAPFDCRAGGVFHVSPPVWPRAVRGSRFRKLRTTASKRVGRGPRTSVIHDYFVESHLVR